MGASLAAGVPTSDTLAPGDPPLTLVRLRDATERERDAVWPEFIAEHNAAVIHACRAVARDHDMAMDAYAHALDALRADGCRRLRAYVPDGNTQFTTWLVVVTRRVAIDYLRQRYGRSRSDDRQHRDEHAMRRRLEDLVGSEVVPEDLTDTGVEAPDAAIRREQMIVALRAALDTLEPADRLLLSLRFIDETPVREIRHLLRFKTIFHVYRRLGTVLSLLRADLIRRGILDAAP